jgi:hypothetical protein
MTDQQNDTALSAGLGPRLLLPVPGLKVGSAWQVGPVLFHPAGGARRLIDTMPPTPRGPGSEVFETWLDGRVSALSESAVAEVCASVSVAGEQLRNPIADEGWPGNGPPCSSCSSALGLEACAAGPGADITESRL